MRNEKKKKNTTKMTICKIILPSFIITFFEHKNCKDKNAATSTHRLLKSSKRVRRSQFTTLNLTEKAKVLGTSYLDRFCFFGAFE